MIDIDAVEALGEALHKRGLDYGVPDLCEMIRTLHDNGWTITKCDPPPEADDPVAQPPRLPDTIEF